MDNFGVHPLAQGTRDCRTRDALSHLDAVPFMGYAEAREGQVVLYGDLFYARLAGSGSMLRDRNFGPIGVGVNAEARGEFEQLVAELGGAYEFARWQSGAAHPAGFVPFTSIEALAGIRYWSQELSVGANVSGAVNIAGHARRIIQGSERSNQDEGQGSACSSPSALVGSTEYSLRFHRPGALPVEVAVRLQLAGARTATG